MRAIFASLALLGLSACGLQPMYAGGGNGAVAQGLAAVEVPAIPGRAGWLVRNELVDRLGAGGNAPARYRLDVRLDDQLEGLGVLGDDTVSRERPCAPVISWSTSRTERSCSTRRRAAMRGSMSSPANMP